jgi:type IV pilus assembly protein PilA
LLIAVAVILLMAAIFVPRITNSHIAPREAAALASLNDVHASDEAYAASYPALGFAPDLATLADFSKSAGRKGVDQELASGTKTGYVFTYTPGERVNGVIQSYTMTAVPQKVGETGQRRFFSDESGKIHYSPNELADAGSPVLQ